MKHFFIKLTISCFWVGFVFAENLPFQSKENKPEILLKADEMSHEKELGIVIARGNVQVSDGKDVLEADVVTYNEKDNMVSASGNVKLYRPNGDVVSANYAELTENLKDGFIRKIYLLTADKERFAAEEARKNDKITTFKKGIYSPCKLCKSDRHAAPSWQLRASLIEREEGEDVHYKNTVLEFKGVPVFYLPYFKHADPSVEKRSGFLMPFVGNNSQLGMVAGTPFYVDISPTQEAIVRPIFMTKENPMLSGEYRQAFYSGDLKMAGSILDTRHRKIKSNSGDLNLAKTQGHFLGEGRFDLTDHWRVNGDISRVTSPAYLKKYYFIERGNSLNENTLTSQLTTEGFYRENYVTVKGYSFQNLRSDISNKSVPVVAPLAEGAYQTPTGRWGEYWRAEGSQMYVARDAATLNAGARTERVSSTLSLVVPYETDVGIVGDLQTYVRGDLYDIKKFTPSSGPVVNQSRGRIIPGMSLAARYPLVNYVEGNRVVLEPIVKLIALPNNLNSIKYPNEDSQDFEFDATNLMRANRFPGIDKVDDGQRVNYGLNFNFYRKSSPLLKGFAGQSYSFSRTKQFNSFPYSGVGKGGSDYVGLVRITPYENYSLYWSTRLGKKDLKVSKNLIQVSLGPPILNVTADYVKIAHDFYQNTYVKSEQVTGGISSRFHENWGVYARVIKELAFKKGELERGAGLIYQNDCMHVKLDVFRSMFKDRYVRPTTTTMLTIGLKNLGEFSTGPIKLQTLSQDPVPTLMEPTP